MSLLKLLIGDINIKTSGEKIGFLFNNTLFNVSTSSIATYVTGARFVKVTAKAIASPSPWCKGIYATSACLNGISCVSSSLCLLSGYSCIGPIPAFFGTFGYVSSLG